MSDIFTEHNGKTTNRIFSIKLLTPSPEELDYKLVQGWHDNLSVSFDNKFSLINTICPKPNSQNDDFFVIHHKKQYRDINSSSSHLQYDDKKVNRHSFQEISTRLYDLYITNRNVNLKKVKLVGHVCDILYEKEGLFLNFRKKYGFYPDENLEMIELKSKFVRDGLNIHLYIYGDISVPEYDEYDEEKNNKDQIQVKVDINNHDQANGINSDTLSAVFECSKNFIKDELVDILNNKIMSMGK